MTDRNLYVGKNTSGLDTTKTTVDPKPPPRYQSKFTELFSSDNEPAIANKPVRTPLPAETLDKNGSAVTAAAPLLSLTESNAPSTASTTYTGYEKLIQPLIQKSSSGNSGNTKGSGIYKNQKVSILPPPTYYSHKKIVIEKKAEVSQETTNSTGVMSLGGNQGDWGVAVVYDHDGAIITGVKSKEEDEEKQYEGDDELSIGEYSSGEEEKSE